MTNLTEKFDELQEQLTGQNTALASALSNIQLTLDAIATALGAPPPGGATLNDVITAISNFESTVSSQFVDIYAVLSQMNERLETIGINTENIYFGQRDLENTILSTACPCDSDIPPLPAPPADLPQPELDLYCQRIQYMLNEFALVLSYFIAAKAGGPVSSSVVSSILSERATANTVGAPSSTTISSVTTALNNASGDIAGAYTELRTYFMYAIFEATTTATAKAAYNSIATSAEGSYGPLFREIAYQDWFNVLYDTAVVWDVSSYDSGACVEPPPLAGDYDFGNGVTEAPWHPPSYLVFWDDYAVLPTVDGSANLDIAALIAAGVTELQFTVVSTSGGSNGQIQIYDSPTDPSPAAFNLNTTYTLNPGDYCIQLYAISGLNAHVRMTVI